MKVINIGICGITGYAGVELAKLIKQHPNLSLVEGVGRLGEVSHLTQQLDVLLLATPPAVIC